MRYRYAILGLAVALLLQGSGLNLIAVFGITPNLILCLVTAFAFWYENNCFAGACAIVGGLLMDICYMPYVGIMAISYFLICLAVICLRMLLNKESLVVTMLVMAAATVTFQLFVWVLSLITGTDIPFLAVLERLPLQLLLNVAVIALLFTALSNRVIRYKNDRYYV
mgnify:CR=1 FL=1